MLKNYLDLACIILDQCLFWRMFICSSVTTDSVMIRQSLLMFRSQNLVESCTCSGCMLPNEVPSLLLFSQKFGAETQRETKCVYRHLWSQLPNSFILSDEVVMPKFLYELSKEINCICSPAKWKVRVDLSRKAAFKHHKFAACLAFWRQFEFWIMCRPMYTLFLRDGK